ncbi:MAG: hypothetical protein NTZ14_19435, partial [Hyphomicrobiales bacterium]|nr:hypothetical protein [Hyphomicrobiales bacterium]
CRFWTGRMGCRRGGRRCAKCAKFCDYTLVLGWRCGLWRGNWYYCADLPGEYTTFQPFLYSLDLILPLVELQQDKDWSPIIPTPNRVMWAVEVTPAAAVPAPAAETAAQGATPDAKPETQTTPAPAAMQDVPAPLLSQLAGFFGELFTSWSWEQAARVVMWFQILFGWVSSLLLVAVLTGLTNREKQDDT